MSKLELAGTLKRSPGPLARHCSLPASRYSQPPATHSMVSGSPVRNVNWEGRTTPTDFLLPSARARPWLTHLPWKYTLALVVTRTASRVSVVMGSGSRGRRRWTGRWGVKASNFTAGIRLCRTVPTAPSDGPSRDWRGFRHWRARGLPRLQHPFKEYT